MQRIGLQSKSKSFGLLYQLANVIGIFDCLEDLENVVRCKGEVSVTAVQVQLV